MTTLKALPAGYCWREHETEVAVVRQHSAHMGEVVGTATAAGVTVADRSRITPQVMLALVQASTVLQLRAGGETA